MTKKEAFPVKAVIGSGTSPDGKQVFLELEHPTGKTVAFAMPPAEASKLIDQAAMQIDACKKLNPPAKGYVSAYPAQGFAIGTDQNKGDVVLAIKFGIGGSVTYQVPRELAEKMHEQIGAELAKKSGANVKRSSPEPS